MSKFKNKDELLKALEEREESLKKKKEEINKFIEVLKSKTNIDSKDFRKFNLSHSSTEIIKVIGQLHKLDVDIDSELMNMYSKALDYILKEEKMKKDEDNPLKLITREQLDKLLEEV